MQSNSTLHFYICCLHRHAPHVPLSCHIPPEQGSSTATLIVTCSQRLTWILHAVLLMFPMVNTCTLSIHGHLAYGHVDPPCSVWPKPSKQAVCTSSLSTLELCVMCQSFVSHTFHGIHDFSVKYLRSYDAILGMLNHGREWGVNDDDMAHTCSSTNVSTMSCKNLSTAHCEGCAC